MLHRARIKLHHLSVVHSGESDAFMLWMLDARPFYYLVSNHFHYSDLIHTKGQTRNKDVSLLLPKQLHPLILCSQCSQLSTVLNKLLGWWDTDNLGQG